LLARIPRRATVAFLLYALLCAIIAILVAEGTLHPQKRLLDQLSIDQATQVARNFGSTLQEVSLRGTDEIRMNAWLIRPAAVNGNAVLLLHGLSDNRIGMVGYAELFLAHGYTVLMPDARAHGQSEGAIATYGLLERRDIRAWANWFADREHVPCVFGFGESMGAAQLLQSLEGDPPFCAIVAESPFSNFREIGYDRVGQFVHTGPWLGRTLVRPVIEFAFVYSKWKYGIDLRQVSPEAVVTATKVPVFLIHGQIDSNIPVRHSRRIKSLAPAVVLWEVPGADHCGAVSTESEQFDHRVLDWFTTHGHHPSPASRQTEN
jgi:dipeptidyl aminopeptidase/acylaminoacyl peptidase